MSRYSSLMPKSRRPVLSIREGEVMRLNPEIQPVYLDPSQTLVKKIVSTIGFKGNKLEAKEVEDGFYKFKKALTGKKSRNVYMIRLRDMAVREIDGDQNDKVGLPDEVIVAEYVRDDAEDEDLSLTLVINDTDIELFMPQPVPLTEEEFFVLNVIMSGYSPSSRPTDTDEWINAIVRLEEKGLVTEGGAITVAGKNAWLQGRYKPLLPEPKMMFRPSAREKNPKRRLTAENLGSMSREELLDFLVDTGRQPFAHRFYAKMSHDELLDEVWHIVFKKIRPGSKRYDRYMAALKEEKEADDARRAALAKKKSAKRQGIWVDEPEEPAVRTKREERGEPPPKRLSRPEPIDLPPLPPPRAPKPAPAPAPAVPSAPSKYDKPSEYADRYTGPGTKCLITAIIDGNGKKSMRLSSGMLAREGGQWVVYTDSKVDGQNVFSSPDLTVNSKKPQEMMLSLKDKGVWLIFNIYANLEQFVSLPRY